MKRVFADTFYFLALLNPGDNRHKRAVAHATAFSGEMVTTAWVLTELADAMSDPRNRLEFISTLNDLKANPQMKIIPVSSTLFDDGIRLFADRPDKEWSLTDCISFTVMTQEKLTDALTADHHFEQAGFKALLK